MTKNEYNIKYGGEKTMLSELGKFLRKFRIDNGLLLKNMADTLGISPAYLSSIENSKRKPTDDLIAKIKYNYHLTPQKEQELQDAYCKTIKAINIDTSLANANQREIGLVFARKINGLSDEQIAMIQKILSNNKK